MLLFGWIMTSDWHLGQCLLAQVMEISPLPALWGVFSIGGKGIANWGPTFFVDAARSR
jgi:hypothetical protein